MAVLCSDNLRVPSEMHVFRSVVSWLEADESRLQQVLIVHIKAAAFLPCLYCSLSTQQGAAQDAVGSLCVRACLHNAWLPCCQ